MGNPSLDPETALKLVNTLLYCITCILGGSVLLGLTAYIVFLCREILSHQSSSKTPLGRVPQPISCAPVAEDNLDLIHVETPIPVEAESLNGEAVPVPALPHDAQISMAPVAATLESK
jgi:hypothetical protein